MREKHHDVHVWGSGKLIHTLISEGLLDRLDLWIYPIVLGQGRLLFSAGLVPSSFRLIEPPAAFPKGAVLLRYANVGKKPSTKIMADT